jgi:hypothetical protein
MSEEAENTGGSLKSILIGLASTIALGVGGYVTKQLTGETEEAAPAATTAPAPVININQAAAAPAVAPQTVIINKSAGPAPAAAPAKPKAKTAKEELEEAPKW